MDIAENDSAALNGPRPETEAVSFNAQDVIHASDPTEAGEETDLSPAVVHELARRWAFISEGREAKIRELQELIRIGVYYVPDEELADKMLRSALQDDLP